MLDTRCLATAMSYCNIYSWFIRHMMWDLYNKVYKNENSFYSPMHREWFCEEFPTGYWDNTYAAGMLELFYSYLTEKYGCCGVCPRAGWIEEYDDCYNFLKELYLDIIDGGHGDELKESDDDNTPIYKILVEEGLLEINDYGDGFIECFRKDVN